LAALPERPTTRPVHAYGGGSADALEAALARDGDMALAPVPAETAAEFRSLLNDGFAMMADAIPDLHAEIDTIVREVLLAHAPATETFEFDGASHYQFWGLLMLNPKHHKTPLAVVEVLAHEASHSLLFGLTIDEPLVFNADDELYVSPLRPDPRPMDGIYHATYVSARMAWAMERMAEALSGADRAAALEAAARDRANFDGATVEVTTGEALLEANLPLIHTVGRASDQAPRLIDLTWGDPAHPAVTLVGKGETFDTGGISLKPGPGMEDMKWDMGGAGAVTGALAALAGRKAKANLIGVIGLVENMPDGNAQRPGDVVTSMSG